MDFNISNLKKLFALFLVLTAGVCAVIAVETKKPERIDTLLERFDRKPGLERAREFFAYMDEEEFMDEPVVFPASTPLDSMQALVWYWAGEWYYAEQDYPRAEKNLERALEAMKCADNVSISDNLAMLGLAYMRQSKYEDALKCMHQCYQLDVEIGDPDRISSSLNTIAGTLLSAGNSKEAEGYILRAIGYAKQAKNPARMAVVYGMASEIEHALENDQKAFLYADSACVVEATTGNTYKMMVRLSQKASIMDGLGRYEEAYAILIKVVPFFRQIGDQMSLVISLNKLGLAAHGLGNNEEALGYLYESIETCQRIGDIYNETYAQREVYEILFKADPDEARMHLERYHLLKDSLYSHATAEQVARFNVEFGKEELEKEKDELTQTKNRLIGYGVLGIIAVIIGVIIAVIVRRKRQEIVHQQLSTMMEELNGVRKVSAQQQAPPAEVPQQQEDYLTKEDKQFLKKLIMSVTQMMDHQTVTVTQVADKMCMSPKTLNRRVQYLTGEGAKRYMMRIQLEQARIMLLKNPDIPIVEVGNKCGFEDHSSFTRTFSNYFGMPPSDYRTTRGQG